MTRKKDKMFRNPASPYFIAEIGINHNGSLEIAKQLIALASVSGADAVKFQKRTPAICVPEHQKTKLRETPWGNITYLQYKEKMEFSMDEYLELKTYTHQLGMEFSASAWDLPSLEFLQEVGVDFHKIASALATHDEFVAAVARLKMPTYMSTGMMTLSEVDKAVEIFTRHSGELTLFHTVSTYPTPEKDLNLNLIPWLSDRYALPVGYSGHESSVSPSVVAVALGAVALERHITLDRAMWGTDHAASLNPQGLIQLVGAVKKVGIVLGLAEKKLFPGEDEVASKLRYW